MSTININILADSLKVFFNKGKNRAAFLDVIMHRSSLSLRLLDFLCTQYSKLRSCEITLDASKKINIYSNYKGQLHSYSKKNFDPFCRGERYEITLTDEVTGKNLVVDTTIAQLNFFRWAIHNKILDFAEENEEDIMLAMNRVSKRKSKKKSRVKDDSQPPVQPSFRVTFN